MKAILYIVILALSGVIICLSNMMADRPYNSANMRSAYYHGCNFGTVAGMQMSVNTVSRCNRTADIFKDVLDTDVITK